jgi:hypothetical protein
VSATVESGTSTCACGKRLKDAYLCRRCAAELKVKLRRLPNLELTTYRQDRIAAPGAGSSGKGNVRPLPWKLKAADLLGRCHENVTYLAGLDAEQVRLGSTAAAIVDRVDRWIGEISRTIDLPQTHVYLGRCDKCGVELYAERGGELCLCKTRNSPASDHVGERMDDLLRRSREVVASPSTIATALTSLDQPVTEEHIRKWKERGRLTPRKHDTRGWPMYRVGDVLDLLNHEAALAARRKQA